MTCSIVAINRKTKTLGVATATGNTYVGERVPHIKKGVAAIATQGLTEISYGIIGLELLGSYYAPHEVLKKLLRNDSSREFRQVIMIDANGMKAAFTGRKTPDHKGHIIGEDYVVAGNLLANENVIKEMARAFMKREEFADRLIRALDNGKSAGGDRREERSAALIVEPKSRKNPTLIVDDHHDPIKELRLLVSANEHSS